MECFDGLTSSTASASLDPPQNILASTRAFLHAIVVYDITLGNNSVRCRTGFQSSALSCTRKLELLRTMSLCQSLLAALTIGGSSLNVTGTG